MGPMEISHQHLIEPEKKRTVEEQEPRKGKKEWREGKERLKL